LVFAGENSRGGRGREFSDETERLIDHAVRDLVGHALERAVAIITANRPLHDRTAQLLLEKETLEEEDIETLRSQIIEPAALGPQKDPEAPKLAPVDS
jgi:cell division protease FtsH